MSAAREGDVVIIVDCCTAGPVAVLESRRLSWRCGRCKRDGFDIERATLGPGGALPDLSRHSWRELRRAS